MRKLFIVLGAFAIFILIITPVPLGTVLVIMGLIVPFKHWPYGLRLMIRFGRVKWCKPMRRLLKW